MKHKPSFSISFAVSLVTFCGLAVPSHADPLVVVQPAGAMIMDTTLLADHVTQFSEEDRWFFGVATDAEVSAVNNGVYGGQFVKNAEAYDYLKDNIPLFDCPDPEFLKTYYFRWWTFRIQRDHSKGQTIHTGCASRIG